MVSQINTYKPLANLVRRGLVLLCRYMTQSMTYDTQHIPPTCNNDLLWPQKHKVRSQFSELLSSSFDMSHFKQTLEFNTKTWILTKKKPKEKSIHCIEIFFRSSEGGRRRNKEEN
jgi:hypothetical protein